MIDLTRLEIQLKKRLNYPYHWGRKQSDDWDNRTNFIYECRSFSQLKDCIQDFDNQLQNYALNRWLNFWSAQGVEQIFCEHQSVAKHDNHRDKFVDFYINKIPFDHKTSVFPKGFNQSLKYAQNNKRALIDWLYTNQSDEGRNHYKNRIFIVLYDKDGKHWRLKAEISLIQTHIKNYLDNFHQEKLEVFIFDNQTVYSDIIWIIR